MSKSGFRPCAARVSEKIRKILSFVFAVVMPISVEAVFDSTSAFLVLGKGFQYVVGQGRGQCHFRFLFAFSLARVTLSRPDSIYSHFCLRACAECTVLEPFCSTVKTGGSDRASEACEKAVIFVSERIFLHFSIKGLSM